MPRKVVALAVLVLSALAVGLTWFAQVRAVEDMGRLAAEARAVLAEPLGDLASTQDLVDHRREVDVVEQRLCELVSDGHWPREPLEIIATLTDLAASSGVVRPEVTIGKEEASPFDCGVALVQTHFSLKGQANFKHARALFDQLESQRYLLRPAEISLAEGPDGGLAQMTIDIVYTEFKGLR